MAQQRRARAQARRDAILQLDCPAFPRLSAYYARMLRRPAYVEHVYGAERRHQTLDDAAALRRLPLPSATAPAL